ncbi:tyrosine-type recombinase/integrase [Streptosporangium sp. NPDC051023]|uniref:tyrosine-type recombinase/integrase n=1 Tax=Streptosporangium sp. NPDC051023 TaxID=3155410 RepID=UPI00344E885D
MSEIVPAEQLPVLPPPPRSENPYWTYLSSLDSEESQRTMRFCLERLARILGYPNGESVPWGMLRFQHTAALRAELAKQVSIDRDGTAAPWSPSTINKHLVALRKVLEAAWMLGQMTAEEFHRAKAVKSAKGGRRAKAGRNIAEEEVVAMLTVCLTAGDLIGLRDAAVIALLQSTGVRREELSNARRSDYDPGERSLRITGKGNTSREVYIHEVAARYLGRWLAITEDIRGPLFAPVNRWGQAVHRPMTPDAVAKMINRRRLQAGLPRLSPHDFRRTFAGALLDDGVDLARVQQLMGHLSPTTTADYDRRPGRQRKAAVEGLAKRLPRPEDL